MAILVHITNIDNKKSIIKNGIKLGIHNVVYFMPHQKEFLISHQWGRELKRYGIKNFMAVDFKIPTNETVWFGKYTSGHEKMNLNTAIEKFMALDDKLGYEFFIERKIEAKEIHKMRNIPKPIGWRYEPKAHGKVPCPCRICMQFGGYKTNKLKEKPEKEYSNKEAKEILISSNNEDEILNALSCLRGKWRKESPKYLERLLEHKDEFILYSLTDFIFEHRHPLRKTFLEILSNIDDEDTRELATEYLEKI